MAPHGEALVSSYDTINATSKPPRLPNDGLKRSMSDISFEITKEAMTDVDLAPISEVEDAKCECCGMSEECTPEYIEKIRGKFLGKWICGLCSEAVKEEMEKNGGKKEEALNTHMHACVRFNEFGRAYPVLYQAEAMREMFKKNASKVIRTKSMNPRDKGTGPKVGAIARSSSCIPAITRDINDFKIT